MYPYAGMSMQVYVCMSVCACACVPRMIKPTCLSRTNVSQSLLSAEGHCGSGTDTILQRMAAALYILLRFDAFQRAAIPLSLPFSSHVFFSLSLYRLICLSLFPFCDIFFSFFSLSFLDLSLSVFLSANFPYSPFCLLSLSDFSTFVPGFLISFFLCVFLSFFLYSSLFLLLPPSRIFPVNHSITNRSSKRIKLHYYFYFPSSLYLPHLPICFHHSLLLPLPRRLIILRFN